MARKRPPTQLAQPPWTYAPVEVMDWLSSGVGRRSVKRFVTVRLRRRVSMTCTTAEAARAMRRFERRVANRVRNGDSKPGDPHSPRRGKIVREGKFAGVLVRVEAREKADRVLLLFTFHPPLPEHRVHRLLTELGLHS